MRLSPTRGRWLALLSLTGFYYVIPNARIDFSRFNAHDSEAYLALSYGLVHGLGYTRSMVPGQYLPHRWWPPGMPVLMAPAVALSGLPVNWLILKLTVATIGILGVVLAWILTKRLTGDDRAADIAALLLGLNVWYWDFSHQVMAEVPVTVWVIGSLLLIDRVWAARRLRLTEAVAVGVCCGVGMLIKAHAIGLLIAPLAYLAGPRRVARPRIFVAACCVLFALGFLLPSALWAARNQRIPAGGPDSFTQLEGIRHRNTMDPDSPTLTLTETAGVVVFNLRMYVIYNIPSQVLPGLWSQSTLQWRGSGTLALILTAVVGLLCWPRARLYSLHLAVVPMALINLIFVSGGAGRYWLPVSSLLLLIVAMRLAELFKSVQPTFRYSALAVGLLVANLCLYVYQHERAPYDPDGPWRELAELFEKIRVANLSPVIGVLGPHSQALQLSTGLPAPITDGAVYDHVVRRTDGPGAQPPDDAVPVVELKPWALFKLARPMTIEGDAYASGLRKSK